VRSLPPQVSAVPPPSLARATRGTLLEDGVGMLPALALLTLAVSAADHWTTYLCLRAPVPGWEVAEANPLAAWLFHSLGLVQGLLVDSAVTLLAVAFLLATPRVPRLAKLAFLGAVTTWTGLAVANNLGAIQQLGLSPLG